MYKIPTFTQIRKHYNGLGYTTRITMQGRITIKPDPDYHPGSISKWQDARYVSEHCVDPDTGEVFLH